METQRPTNGVPSLHWYCTQCDNGDRYTHRLKTKQHISTLIRAYHSSVSPPNQRSLICQCKTFSFPSDCLLANNSDCTGVWERTQTRFTLCLVSSWRTFAAPGNWSIRGPPKMASLLTWFVGSFVFNHLLLQYIHILRPSSRPIFVQRYLKD